MSILLKILLGVVVAGLLLDLLWGWGEFLWGVLHDLWKEGWKGISDVLAFCGIVILFVRAIHAWYGCENPPPDGSPPPYSGCSGEPDWFHIFLGGFYCACGVGLIVTYFKLSEGVEEAKQLRADKKRSDYRIASLAHRLTLLEDGRLQDLPAEELARITGDTGSGDPPAFILDIPPLGDYRVFPAMIGGREITFTSEGLALGSLCHIPGGTAVFCGRAYNGSNWTVMDLTLKVIAKEKDGTARWTREFNTCTRSVDFDSLPRRSLERLPESEIRNEVAEPLSPIEVWVSVPDAQGIGSSEWSIVKARGYKEE